MATVAVTTSPVTLDSGSSEFVTVTNAGTVDVAVARGSQSFTLRPGQSRTVYPEGSAVTASVVSGSGQVSTSAQAARLSQVQQYAADAAFTGTYATPAKVAPAATGVAATDTAALQAAINATPQGGRLYIPFGTYLLNAALTIPKSITIAGDSIAATFAPGSQGGNSAQPNSPFLAGTILKQTVAATDVIAATTSAVSLNLLNLGLMFASGLASTGHGVNGQPSLDTGTGKDFGITDFSWQNVTVYGHDGNHYAFVLLNTQLGTLVNLRSYGGGGIRLIADLGTINSGNLVIVHPWINVFNAGTANGIQHEAAVTSGHPGMLNLIQYHRPQVSISGAANTQGTQRPYNDRGGAGDPRYVSVYDPDFESLGTGNQPVFGAYTQLLGAPLVDGGNARDIQSVRLGQSAGASMTYDVAGVVAVGKDALKSSTNAAHNTAVGAVSLQNITTNDQSTALGYAAGQYATGQQNTAIGYQAFKGVNGSSTAANNTAVGCSALTAATTGDQNCALGHATAQSVTTGQKNTCLGYAAGYFSNASTGNAITTGTANTYIGHTSGSPSGSVSNATALGFSALAAANATAIGASVTASGTGSVAIGRDSAGTGASTSVNNVIALGTANHQVQLSNNTTGAGSAALGANCPATTATAPYAWFKMMSSDGSTVYVPAWK